MADAQLTDEFAALEIAGSFLALMVRADETERPNENSYFIIVIIVINFVTALASASVRKGIVVCSVFCYT